MNRRQLLFEDEIHRTNQAQASPEEIHLERLMHIEQTKGNKYRQGYNLL
jgi:hypothetical protein